MITKDIQVNYSIVERFKNLESTKRLAHAYLFVGSAHIGKTETALTIAKMFCCEGEPAGEQLFCGQCSSCKKIDSSCHPDIHFINSDFGEQIKIEQIRELLTQVKLRPFMAQKKIFIIKNVENITLEGSNALLKTLEEPAGDSLLILTTSVPEKNLDTIKSRCHMVRFLSATQQDLARHIKKHYNEDEITAQYFAYFAEGCFGKVKLLQEKKWFQKKNEIIDGFLYKGWNDDVIKKILEDKEKVKELLDVLLSWIRDCMLIKHDIEQNNLINIDREEDLKGFADRFTFEELVDLNREIIKTCKLLSEKLNLKIPISVIKEML
ncbi:MAG: hypothetical protein KKD07_04465 [Candidatus Omnitrophica bacterium]|nr:hypothetical protein [Candidatus Omnitrophota bacterium]MBU1997786.1 hypothetical protein [Candidatus Omnitrophota bacterium]MBU4333679.1 hypothetical protein [Candidatus Omnitrophota bacterium]